MNKLVISNLSKIYSKKKVLNNINLELKPGIYGILGPNGAGKTTLMKCIVDLVPYEGKITIDSNYKKNIGYLPQKFSLFKQLTVMEALEYVAILKKVENKNEIEEVIREVNLENERNKKVKYLSGGMLRRLGIAQALLGNPQILIIDEPTVGLDPKERMRFRNLLAGLKRDIIIMISSHIVEDLENIAESIAIMKEGEIVIQGEVNSLLSEIKNKVGIIEIANDKLDFYKKSYNITSIKNNVNSMEIKIIGDTLPENTKIIKPTIEDLYFYYNGVEDDE